MKTAEGTVGTTVLLSVALTLMAGLSWQLVHDLRARQHLVQDRAEFQHVKYGMLNADLWVEQISAILEKKVRELQLRGEQREAMKRTLENILERLVTEVDRYLREQNLQGNWWGRTKGRFKERVRDAVVDIDTVKAGIPEYAEQILVELENPETRKEIGNFLTGLIGEVADSTFAQADNTLLEAIYQRYKCSDTPGCVQVIESHIDTREGRTLELSTCVILLALLMLLVTRRTYRPDYSLPWLLLALSTVLLLSCGVLTPMIEVEARIASLRFMLMGYPVEFSNEVFYFQSKSILDVVSILLDTREADTILVGILLMTFSVVFPTLKLLASVAYVLNPGGQRHTAPVHFFALKSGKWSMADVMVIAIFMAYIGFDGMVSSQLELIKRGAASAGVDVLTTNGTTLQPGFYMFVAFCVFSLAVSTVMESTVGSSGEERPIAGHNGTPGTPER